MSNYFLTGFGSCPRALHIPSAIMALPHSHHLKKLPIFRLLQGLDRCQNSALFLQQELAGVSHLTFEINQIFLHLFIPVKMSLTASLSAIYSLLRFQYEDTVVLLCFT